MRLLEDLVELIWVLQQPVHRCRTCVSGLLHTAEDDGEQGWVDAIGRVDLSFRHAVVHPVGDSGVVGFVFQPCHHRVDDRADLTLGLVGVVESLWVKEVAVLI